VRVTAAPHPGDRCPCGAPAGVTWRTRGRATRLCVVCGLDRLLAERQASGCLLCAGVAATVGIFLPDEPRLYGARHGGPRMLRYSLCARCYSRGDRCERVEDALAIATGMEGAA